MTALSPRIKKKVVETSEANIKKKKILELSLTQVDPDFSRGRRAFSRSPMQYTSEIMAGVAAEVLRVLAIDTSYKWTVDK